MEKKQTAVDWLIDSLPQIDWEHPHYAQLFNHAKQMEKEQSVEFWQGGINCTEEGGKSFEQYYNETYKK